MDLAQKEKLKKIVQWMTVLLLIYSLYSCYQAKHQHIEIPLPKVFVQHPKTSPALYRDSVSRKLIF